MSDRPAIIISHSEVESYLSCQMKHYYAFGDSTFGDQTGLEPKVFSDALFRGLTGHEALEVFYKALLQGESYDEAINLSQAHLLMMSMRPEILNHAAHLNIVTDLRIRILPRYFNTAAKEKYDEGWRPAHVEETFRLEMDFPEGRFIYPFKPDVNVIPPYLVMINWLSIAAALL